MTTRYPRSNRPNQDLVPETDGFDDLLNAAPKAVPDWRACLAGISAFLTPEILEELRQDTGSTPPPKGRPMNQPHSVPATPDRERAIQEIHDAGVIALQTANKIVRDAEWEWRKHEELQQQVVALARTIFPAVREALKRP